MTEISESKLYTAEDREAKLKIGLELYQSDDLSQKMMGLYILKASEGIMDAHNNYTNTSEEVMFLHAHIITQAMVAILRSVRDDMPDHLAEEMLTEICANAINHVMFSRREIIEDPTPPTEQN